MIKTGLVGLIGLTGRTTALIMPMALTGPAITPTFRLAYNRTAQDRGLKNALQNRYLSPSADRSNRLWLASPR
jgi:hypothetical protein